MAVAAPCQDHLPHRELLGGAGAAQPRGDVAAQGCPLPSSSLLLPALPLRLFEQLRPHLMQGNTGSSLAEGSWVVCS